MLDIDMILVFNISTAYICSCVCRWLAVSDLCAASGIALRSALWLWDSAAMSGGLEPEDVSPGRLLCVVIAVRG